MPNKNREARNAYSREWCAKNYKLRRAQMFEVFGGKCFECGIAEHLSLQQQIGDNFDLSSLWQWSQENWEKIKDQIWLACLKHRRNHRRGHLKHGAYWSAYKKKCQCDACLQFKIDYAEKRREKRAANRPPRLSKPPKIRQPRPPKPKMPKPQPSQEVSDLVSDRKQAPKTSDTRAPHGSFHMAVNLGCRCGLCIKVWTG